MSESSRKRKHKRSSKEDETFKDQQKGERSKRRHNENHHSREDTCPIEEERRQIKKAAFKLCRSTGEETDRRQVSQTEVTQSKTKRNSASTHKTYPHKVEPNIAGKDKCDSGSKIKERRPSRSRNVKNSHKDHYKDEKGSKCSSDKKSCHASPHRLKTKRRSPSNLLEEQRKRCWDLLKSKCKDIEIQKTLNKSKTKETKKQNQASRHSKDSKRDKQTELVKETSKESQELLVKENLKTKTCTDFTSQPFSISTEPQVSFQITKSSDAQSKISCPPPPVHSTFKIPKKVKARLVETNTVERSDITSTSGRASRSTEHAVSEAATSTSGFKQPHSYVDVSPKFFKSFEKNDEVPSSSSIHPTTNDAIAAAACDQMQVAEELHLARSERRLEVDVMQSYGELTCMDIDPPEESTTQSLCKQPAQQNVILVLDTNILLSHLDYVKKMQSRGLGVVLIPWVVLQELDSLKKGKGLTNSVAHLACPAISYIYNSLKKREGHLWGQSMQQAAESNINLMAENNDDKVLQCCIQYQSLYPGCVLILCTNDKNLCSKAVLSGVKALSKIDLEAEVERSRRNLNPLQSTVHQRLPQMVSPTSSPTIGRSCTPVASLTQERQSLSLPDEDSKSLIVEEDKMKRCVSEFEECLQGVLSNVLETEMKASYDDLWEEIVYLKPPWSLLDILHCLKKHWKAVFGFIVPRSLLQTVLNLIDFFKQDRSKDCSSTLRTIREAKQFVREFAKRSCHVPQALATMDNIIHKLQPQPKSEICDVVMNEDDEAKQPPSPHISHHEVWAMFENIWCKVCEISLEVFKALAFDPHSRLSAFPAGGPAPPRDAVVCLRQMSSVVSQLLQAFLGILSSSPGLQEVQVLLNTIKSNKMVDMNSRLADTDLLSCFSQQDYREKLRVGVNQLTELKEALDHCVQTTGQHVTLNLQ
ncbi:transcriptional protein SWT1 [Syngnathoides biaculeatus]|uniref:transcriptional protein SWT1 n=1 Tax=Syngnathoides biaculeatus TaxID=300417 RepID=UPI002ADDDF97|nr:transcriptional protein SWT1 [Syngnathoides biaculeatus]XP_061680432.1 transcriptional protein SWT1 [Syngnathoides biaculeatus]XP_061680433.1 transcriptional protein SWT1 [Syngnathoides biaculeatus]